MIAMLLWIVGCYGLAVAVVHLTYRLHLKLRGKKAATWMHVVIVSHNDERHMEWVIRAYCWFAWIKGRKLKFTVVDHNSSDDTSGIVSRLVQQHDVLCDTVQVHSKKEQAIEVRRLEVAKQPEETLIVLVLHSQSDWRRIPSMVGGAL